jgi:hypothetical protein
MALYGSMWIQDNEPTSGVVPGMEWTQPTTGVVQSRNTSNTAWVYSRNINETQGGSVAVAGSSMTGPLLNSPNLPTLDDPDFQGTIRQDGFQVALMTALAALEKRTYDRLASLVREQFLGGSALSGAGGSIAFDSQTVYMTGTDAISTGVSIQLPTFRSDGVVATPDQVLGYGAALAGFAYHDDPTTLNTGEFHLLETGSLSRVYRLVHTATGTDWIDFGTHNWAISTWILAAR